MAPPDLAIVASSTAFLAIAGALIGILTPALPCDHAECREAYGTAHQRNVARDNERQAQLRHETSHMPEHPVPGCPWCRSIEP